MCHDALISHPLDVQRPDKAITQNAVRISQYDWEFLRNL